MFDCTTDTYNDLYAPWMENPGKLLNFGCFSVDEKLLDLCGGTGTISYCALKRGILKPPVLLDRNPYRNINPDFIIPVEGDVNNLSIEALQKLRDHGPYDLIVCRQAIGYLDLDKTFALVNELLSKTGKFVFNTFVKPKTAFKRYEHEDKKYWEASTFFGKKVFHIQGKGIHFDISIFHWHTNEDILKAARARDLRVHIRDTIGTSSHYMIIRD